MLLSVSYYLLNIDVGSLFSEVLQRINFGVLLFSDHLLHYVEESDRWLGADSILEGAQQSIITKSFQFIFECSIIMSSYIALCLRQEQKVQCFYNIMVLHFLCVDWCMDMKYWLECLGNYIYIGLYLLDILFIFFQKIRLPYAQKGI